jgi:adenylate cyclase
LRGVELIDLNVAPHERKAQRRRRLLRVGVPIIFVALLIGAILGIALFSYESNRRGASVLSDDLLEALETRIGTEVATYLAPAPKMVQFARQTLAGGSFEPDNIAQVEKFGRNVLRTYDQIASFYVSDGAGQFLMILRNVQGGTDTKIITTEDRNRRVRLIRRDAFGQSLAEEEPLDNFDPRSRPWYRGAVAARDLYWTDVYVFFTQRTPGVTTALPFISDDGAIGAVYGVDVTLAALSRFLQGISIGTTGRAMIIDAEGRLIAFPEPDRILRDDNGTLVTRRLDEMDDLALTRAFNRLRIAGHGHGTVDVDGERIVFASTALPIAADKKWSVLIVVPEREIIGFVAANNRTALLLSLSVIIIAALLAGLLVRQGVRADRNARRVRERQDAIEAQSHAFAALADSAALFDADDRRGTSALSESLAGVTGARRISVWRVAHGGRSLVCEDCFDRASKLHTAGIELHRGELGQAWTALCGDDVLDLADAAQDARMGGLLDVYLRPLDIGALMAIPIIRGGEVIGSIWLEDLPPAAQRRAGIESFARTVAHMEAVRIAAPGRDRAVVEPGRPEQRSQAPDAATRRHHTLPGTPASRRETSVDVDREETFQAPQPDDTVSADGATSFPTIAVLTVLLADASELHKPSRTANNGTALAETSTTDAVACLLEEIADTQAIPYLKVLGNCVVAAAGFSGDPVTATRAIAQAALALRDASDLPVRRLRMGIDTGVAFGHSVGRGQRCYNLWGTAIRRSAEMAQSAPLGGIQVTAFAYRNLVGDYLFRPRGGFYVHPEGEMSTYLMAGQL